MTDKPYEPKYKGFDEAATKRAHDTVDRANETAGAQGEDANKEYVDDGPAEYERRMGEAAPGIEEDVPPEARGEDAPPEVRIDETPDFETKATHRGKK